MTQLPNNFFAVVVPEGAKLIHVNIDFNNNIYSAYKFKDDLLGNQYDVKPLPPGQWQIVSLASEITEEQAGEIVEKACGYYTTYFKEPDDMTNVEIIHHERPINGSKITWKRTNKITWFNYLSETHVPETEFDTALESFRSLLKYHSLNEATTLIIKQVK